jgi:hypothetical protein
MLPVLTLALISSACAEHVKPGDGVPEGRSAIARDSIEEDTLGIAVEPINEACLEACLEGNRRAVALCMRLRSPGVRRVCIEAANVVMAACIARCPDE